MEGKCYGVLRLPAFTRFDSRKTKTLLCPYNQNLHVQSWQCQISQVLPEELDARHMDQVRPTDWDERLEQATQVGKFIGVQSHQDSTNFVLELDGNISLSFITLKMQSNCKLDVYGNQLITKLTRLCPLAMSSIKTLRYFGSTLKLGRWQ